nr:hypothetical protein [Kineococcus indalonis]
MLSPIGSVGFSAERSTSRGHRKSFTSTCSGSTTISKGTVTTSSTVMNQKFSPRKSCIANPRWPTTVSPWSFGESLPTWSTELSRNIARPPWVLVLVTWTKVGSRFGRVILKNRCTRPAPSMEAASQCSSGMDRIPAREHEDVHARGAPHRQRQQRHEAAGVGAQPAHRVRAEQADDLVHQSGARLGEHEPEGGAGDHDGGQRRHEQRGLEQVLHPCAAILRHRSTIIRRGTPPRGRRRPDESAERRDLGVIPGRAGADRDHEIAVLANGLRQTDGPLLSPERRGTRRTAWTPRASCSPRGCSSTRSSR